MASRCGETSSSFLSVHGTCRYSRPDGDVSNNVLKMTRDDRYDCARDATRRGGRSSTPRPNHPRRARRSSRIRPAKSLGVSFLVEDELTSKRGLSRVVRFPESLSNDIYGTLDRSRFWRERERKSHREDHGAFERSKISHSRFTF